MQAVLPLALLTTLLAACGGSGSSRPPVLATGLRAAPAVAHPGAAIVLRPAFAGGTARIDPGVGPVESGRDYEVGPLTADTRFTLTVDRDGAAETVAIDVPLRYREQVTELPPGTVARTRAGSALLADGRVLQAGGASPTPVFWSDSEVFTGGEPFPAGSLATARAEATLVALPGGGALSFGGVIVANDFLLATLVEQWDPEALAWSTRGNLTCTRVRHTATRLPDGRVLLAGGLAGGGPVTERDAELWVPGSGPRPPANEMVRRRAAHTATVLADGRVLLIGGYDLGSGDAIAQCEWFDPATEAFAPGPSLGTARFYHAAVSLADGRVLVIGGEQQGIVLLAGAEVFDPATGGFTPVAPMLDARTEVRAVRLLGGDVLVAGGVVAGGDATANATDRIEVWSPASGSWRAWASRLPSARTGHALHVLADGRVVVLGGDPANGFPTALRCVLD